MPTVMGGLVALAVGSTVLAAMPASAGVAGDLVPLVVLTTGYAFFQAANTTDVMSASRADDRGVVAGVLTLARDLGLITGAAAMASWFSYVSGAARDADSTSAGTRATFAVATLMILLALLIARRSQRPRGGVRNQQ